MLATPKSRSQKRTGTAAVARRPASQAATAVGSRFLDAKSLAADRRRMPSRS